MGATIGFSLKIEGKSALINDLDAIEGKLLAVTKAIEAAQNAAKNGGSIKLGATPNAQSESGIAPDTQTQENTRKLKEYTVEQAKLKIQAAQTRKEIDNQAKAAVILSQNLDPGSVVRMRFEVARLKEEYYKLSPAQRDATEGQKKFNDILKLETNIRKVEQSLGDFRRQVGDYKKALVSVGDLATGGLIGGGIITAFQKLGDLGHRAIEEFEQAEVALTKVDTILKQTNNSAGFTREQLSQIAIDLGKATNLDNDTILDEVTARLLIYENLSDKVFVQAQKISVDIGRSFKDGVGGAAELVGKLLNQPINAQKQLKQLGIALSEQEATRVKQLSEQNRLEEVQLFLLDKLNKFSGQGIAQANTELARFKALTVEFNEVLEGIGGTLVKIGVGFLDFATDLARGSLFMSEADKILKNSKRELGLAIEEETNFISENITLLKSANVQGKFRQDVIDKLVAKYPELIKNQDLVYASEQRLAEIEKDLTLAVKQEIFKRIEAKEFEALETKRIENEIAIEKLKARTAKPDSSVSPSGVINLISTFDIDKILNPRKAFTEANKKVAEDEIESRKKENQELNKAAEENRKIWKKVEENNKDAASGLKQTYGSIKEQIGGAISEIQKALDSDKTLSSNKPALKEALQKLLRLDNVIKPETSTQSLGAIKTYLDKIFKLVRDSAKDTRTLLDKDTKESIADAAKALQEQLKRIQDLKNEFNRNQLAFINNEFDKQIKTAESDAANKVAELQLKIDALNNQFDKKNNKKPLTDTDKQEIAAIEALKEQSAATTKLAIDKINDERDKAIRASTQKLRDLYDEVTKINNEIATSTAENTVNDVKTNRDTQIADIRNNLKEETNAIDEEYLNRRISLKKHTELTNDANARAAKKELQILIDTQQDIIDAYKESYAIQEAALRSNLKVQLDAIEQSRKDQLRAVDEDLKTGKTTPILADITRAKINEKANTKIREEEKKTNDEIRTLNDKLVENTKQTYVEITDANKQKNDTISQQDEEATQDRLDALKKLKDGSLELLADIGHAYIEQSQNRSDAEFKLLNKNLEKERKARLSLVKGNAAEEERINREFDQKQEELDRKQFKRNQEIAVLEVEIQTAVAIIKAFATLGPILAVVTSGFLIATAALQISNIKSKSFAEGGRSTDFRKPGEGGKTGSSQAPPDETGKRPVGRAIYHENEYTAPDWQVAENAELIDAMEQDRKDRRYGRTGAIEKFLAQKAMDYVKAEQQRRITPAEGKILAKTETIPIVVYPGDYYRGSADQKAVAELSEESVQLIADTVADAVGIATEKGAFNGIVKSAIQQEIHKNRLARQRKTI